MNNYTNYVIAHKDFEWNTPQWYNDTFTQISTHKVKSNLKNSIVIDSDYDDKLYGYIIKNYPELNLDSFWRIIDNFVK